MKTQTPKEKEIILSEYKKYKRSKKSYSFEETFEDIIYREDEKSIGLSFKKGIDPRILIDALKKID